MSTPVARYRGNSCQETTATLGKMFSQQVQQGDDGGIVGVDHLASQVPVDLCFLLVVHASIADDGAIQGVVKQAQAALDEGGMFREIQGIKDRNVNRALVSDAQVGCNRLEFFCLAPGENEVTASLAQFSCQFLRDGRRGTEKVAKCSPRALVRSSSFLAGCRRQVARNQGSGRTR